MTTRAELQAMADEMGVDPYMLRGMLSIEDSLAMEDERAVELARHAAFYASHPTAA